MLLQKQKKEIDELNFKILEIEEQNYIEKNQLKEEISHAIEKIKIAEDEISSRIVNIKKRKKN